MKRLRYIPAIVIPACLFFLFCEKRPFAHIAVRGRIVNANTNQPLQARVSLWVGGAAPGSKGTSSYGGTETNADGTFYIKSNAQWNGNDYNLYINPDSVSTHSSFSKSIEVPKNKSVDVGTIGA